MYMLEVRTNLGQTRRFGMFHARADAISWAYEHEHNESLGAPWPTWEPRKVELATAVADECALEHLDEREFASPY
jgi:hypothetical protein